MIERRQQKILRDLLQEFPAVALLGPRQVGKTTLARALKEWVATLYLDLESEKDQAKLDDLESYLSAHRDRLIILDEVHHIPNLFQSLRGLIDQGRYEGHHHGQLLLLGSASMNLLKQSAESLAGRIAYLELGGLDILEVGAAQCYSLWSKGGFPESFLAANETKSFRWRQNFLKTYLNRDIPQLGPRIAAETLRRLWTMLAHCQSTMLNAAQLASSLAVDGSTVKKYLDLMVDLLLVRRLQPWHSNMSKRLVKSPKVYIRDSGLAHALLGIQNFEELLSHPIAGPSWEAFVVENLISIAPEWTEPYFYRTAVGAEIDLLLKLPGNRLWAIEIKKGIAPKVEKGFYQALEDIQPERAFIVYSGEERYPIKGGVEVISLHKMAELLTNAHVNPS